MAAGDVIVQSTHSHAAPTLEGIWGPVAPAYLKLVHDRIVQALADAAKAARPASLQWGSVDAPYLDNIDVAQTDSYSGWVQDGQLSVLRAVDPRDARTIASFTNVPVHGDIVNGAGLKLLSADYFGFVRRDLDEKLGGVNVVGPATLGLEESPVQPTGLEATRCLGTGVASRVHRPLSAARWVTAPTIAANEQELQAAGTNASLLALTAANRRPADQKQQAAAATGMFPIDRSGQAPY